MAFFAHYRFLKIVASNQLSSNEQKESERVNCCDLCHWSVPVLIVFILVEVRCFVIRERTVLIVHFPFHLFRHVPLSCTTMPTDTWPSSPMSTLGFHWSMWFSLLRHWSLQRRTLPIGCNGRQPVVAPIDSPECVSPDAVQLWSSFLNLCPLEHPIQSKYSIM